MSHTLPPKHADVGVHCFTYGQVVGVVVLPLSAVDDGGLAVGDVIARGTDKQLADGMWSKSRYHPGVAMGAAMSS